MRVLALSALALICLAGLSFSWYARNEWGFGDAWLNLGTEIVGILLTLLFVDRIVRHIQEQERKRVEGMALRALGPALRSHRDLLFSIVKATSAKPTDDDRRDGKTRLREDVPPAMQRLDFREKAPVAIDQPWHTYLAGEFAELTEKVGKIIERYSGFLAASAAEYLQSLEDSSLSGLMPHLKRVDKQDGTTGVKRSGDYLRDATVRPVIEAHLEAFVRVAEAHDAVEKNTVRRVLRLPDLVWRDDLGPTAMSGLVGDSYGPPIIVGEGPPPQ